MGVTSGEQVSRLSVEWPQLLAFGDARKERAQQASAELAMHCNGVGWRLTPLKPGGHLVVWLERQAPRGIKDRDLARLFRPIRRQIAAFFGVPDNHPALSWCYKQTKGPAMVRIEFEVLTADAVLNIRERIGDNAREVVRMAELAGVLP